MISGASMQCGQLRSSPAAGGSITIGCAGEDCLFIKGGREDRSH
jgi:hypothetical protein